MQKKKWVRVGLATVIVGGALVGISMAGCSGDDSTPATKTDSGTKGDSSIPPGDSSIQSDSNIPSDSSPKGDGEGGNPVPNAKVYIVNAATNPLAPPLRFCFGLATATDGGGPVTVAGGIAPFPDYKLPGVPVAGLPAGLGGSTASSAQLKAFDLSTLTIALYALNAVAPAVAGDTADGGPDGGAEVPCEGLIGTDALGKGGAGGGILTLGTDYWYLGTIPKGTLAHGTTWVAAVTGCTPGEPGPSADAGPGSALCNNTKLPTYDPAKGNLTLTAWMLDSTTAVTGDAGIGAQFANASPSWDVESQGLSTALGAGAASTAAGFWQLALPPVSDAGTTSDAGDAGDAAVEAAAPTPVFTPSPITATGPFGTLNPAALASVPNIPLNNPHAGFFVALANVPSPAPPGCTVGASCLSPYPEPLPLIDYASNGSTYDPGTGTVTTPAGGSYAYGKGYVFILVGDPSAPQTCPANAPACGPAGSPNLKAAHFLGFSTSNP